MITNHDRVKQATTMRVLGDDLTDDSVTQKYTHAGDIGGLKPERRWTADKIVVNLVFNQIKSSYEPKDVWENERSAMPSTYQPHVRFLCPRDLA